MKTTFYFILGPLLPQQASRPLKKTSNNMAKKHNPKKKGNIPFHQKANRHFSNFVLIQLSRKGRILKV